MRARSEILCESAYIPIRPCRRWADRKSSSTRWPGSFSPWGTSRWCWPPGADRRARSTRLPCPIPWSGIRGSCPRAGACRGMAIGWRGCTAPAASTWSIATEPIRPATWVPAARPCVTCRWSSPAMATTWRRWDFTIASRSSAGDIAWPWKRADAAVAISDYTAEMFREACPELRRIVPIPNGVEVEQFAAPVPRPANIAACDSPEILSALPGPARSAEGDRRAVGGDGLAPRPMRSRPGRGRAGTGRPGTGSPDRAAGSCPAGPFRRPDGGSAEDCGCCKTAYVRSFPREPGKPLASWWWRALPPDDR